MAKKNKLKKLTVSKVDLVNDGSNPDAFVNLFKSKSVSVPIKKDAQSFNEKIKEEAVYDIARQIYKFISALECSLISILHDDDAKNKPELMSKSLEQFYGAATLSAEAWGNGKLSEYEIADVEPDNEAVEIIKSIKADDIAGRLVAGIKKAINEPGTAEEGEETDMTLEDIKKSNNLTDEEKAQFESLFKKAGGEEGTPTGADGTEPPAKGAGGNGTALQKSLVAANVTEPTPNTGDETTPSTEDDIYKGVSPAVAEELKEFRKYREESETRELTEVAKKYEIIGKKAETLVPVLKSLKAEGGTAYNDMISILDAAVETVTKSGAFNEVGKNGHASNNGVENSTAVAKAKEYAAEIKKSKPNMTDAQAMAEVWDTHPELIDEYDQEMRGE